jgi:hypothetical protein
MKGHRFGQNASFHLKGKGSKNMSEFTLVLNLWFVQSSPKLQFWFKINAIASLPKIKQWPWSWPPFSLWSWIYAIWPSIEQ